MPLIAYDFRDRRQVDCYKCGFTFPDGRYREHVMNSTHPRHHADKSTRVQRRGENIVSANPCRDCADHLRGCFGCREQHHAMGGTHFIHPENER